MVKTLLVHGLSTLPIKGNPVFSNGPKILPIVLSLPNCPILCNWVNDNFILAVEPFAKAWKKYCLELLWCSSFSNDKTKSLFTPWKRGSTKCFKCQFYVYMFGWDWYSFRLIVLLKLVFHCWFIFACKCWLIIEFISIISGYYKLFFRTS